MRFPNLKERRRSRGFNRKHFQHFNISERTMATLETDDCNPRIETIEKVAKALETTIDDLRANETATNCEHLTDIEQLQQKVHDLESQLKQTKNLEKENESLKEQLNEKDQEIITYLKELNEIRKSLLLK